MPERFFVGQKNENGTNEPAEQQNIGQADRRKSQGDPGENEPEPRLAVEIVGQTNQQAQSKKNKYCGNQEFAVKIDQRPINRGQNSGESSDFFVENLAPEPVNQAAIYRTQNHLKQVKCQQPGRAAFKKECQQKRVKRRLIKTERVGLKKSAGGNLPGQFYVRLGVDLRIFEQRAVRIFE